MRLKDGPLIALIITLSVFAPISTDMYLSALPDMMVHFSTNESVMNMTLYGFLLSLTVSSLFIGPISDKYGRKPVLIVSMILYTIMSVLCAFVDDITVMIVLRVIQAIGGGGAMVVSIALIKDCFEPSKIGSIMTIVTAIGVIGPVLAPIIGTILTELSDWRATFIAPAIISAVCLVASLVMDETLDDRMRYTGSIVGSVRGLSEPLRDRDFFRFLLISTVFNLPFLGYIGVSSYIYQTMFGTSDVMYSVMLAVTILTAICIMMAIRRIQSKVSPSVSMMLYLAFAVAGCVLLFTVAPMNEYLFLISVIPVAVLITSIRPFGFDILMAQHEGDNGSVSSLLNFCTFGFGVVGMAVCSLQVWDSFITGIAAMMLVATSVFAVCWFMMRRSPSRLKGLEDI
ncbi:MAG: MFS transporter [Candidatus Methanomethylophilaceae archaeon]